MYWFASTLRVSWPKAGLWLLPAMKILRRCMGEQNSAADTNGPTTSHMAGALEGLGDEILELKAGERVKRSGKKRNDKRGNLTFQVKKIKQDYGLCEQ